MDLNGLSGLERSLFALNAGLALVCLAVAGDALFGSQALEQLLGCESCVYWAQGRLVLIAAFSYFLAVHLGACLLSVLCDRTSARVAVLGATPVVVWSLATYQPES